MDNTVSWILELAIAPGRDDDFEALMKEMVETVQANEPGTLNYEWSKSADGTTCHLFERYADSDATMIHLGNFMNNFAPRFMEILSLQRFTLYGSPNAKVKEKLAPFNAVHMPPVGGFSR